MVAHKLTHIQLYNIRYIPFAICMHHSTDFVRDFLFACLFVGVLNFDVTNIEWTILSRSSLTDIEIGAYTVN